MRKIVLSLVLLFSFISAGSAATYYISPSGNDSTGNGTSGNRWATLTKAFSMMNGGDTLIVGDGTYTGGANRISTNNAFPPKGTSSAWTNIQAEHDGMAIFDGQGTNEMLWITWGPACYFTFTGLIWTGTKDTTALVNYSDHIKFFRCGAYDAADGNNVNFEAENSQYILFENCYAWGSGRYKFSFYLDQFCIMRNCVGRLDYVNAGTEPIAIFTVYSSSGCEIQNCIAIDSDQTSKYLSAGTTYDLGGAFYNPATSGLCQNINWTNNIALNVAIGGAGCAGNGEPYNADNITFKNCLWWHISNM